MQVAVNVLLVELLQVSLAWLRGFLLPLGFEAGNLRPEVFHRTQLLPQIVRLRRVAAGGLAQVFQRLQILLHHRARLGGRLGEVILVQHLRRELAGADANQPHRHDDGLHMVAPDHDGGQLIHPKHVHLLAAGLAGGVEGVHQELRLQGCHQLGIGLDVVLVGSHICA